MKERIKHLFLRFPPGLWIWSAATCLFACLATLLLVKIFLAGIHLTRDAIDSGQRVTIHLATGEAEGNMRHTRAAKTGLPSVGSHGIAGGGSGEGLPPAPFAPITEESDKGLLPIIGHDGTMPWKYYARPYKPTAKRPMVAVVLTNLGLSKSLTEAVLALPRDFTLAFSPYASDAKRWSTRAREDGFEALTDMPMQPNDYPISDPGPYGLLDNLDPNETSVRLHWILSRLPGYVGVLAPIDEKLTSNPAIMRPILTELAARGLLFLYVKNPNNDALVALAKTHGFYVLGIDTIIDNEITSDAIDAQLAGLTQLAKKQGYAIGLAHSYPPTTEALTRWAETLNAQGVDLVPVSAIAKQALQ